MSGPYMVKRLIVAGREVRHTPVSAHFDGMSWPTIGTRASRLQWRLRYGSLESITRSDLIYAASIICAYQALVGKAAKARGDIVRVLRAVDAAEYVPDDWHPSDRPKPEDGW